MYSSEISEVQSNLKLTFKIETDNVSNLTFILNDNEKQSVSHWIIPIRQRNKDECVLFLTECRKYIAGKEISTLNFEDRMMIEPGKSIEHSEIIFKFPNLNNKGFRLFTWTDLVKLDLFLEKIISEIEFLFAEYVVCKTKNKIILDWKLSSLRSKRLEFDFIIKQYFHIGETKNEYVDSKSTWVPIISSRFQQFILDWKQMLQNKELNRQISHADLRVSLHKYSEVECDCDSDCKCDHYIRIQYGLLKETQKWENLEKVKEFLDLILQNL